MFDVTETVSGPFGNSTILQELPEQVKSISGADKAERARLKTESLVEIAHRIAERPELVQEAMVAWTLVTCPWVDSTRGIARWSGCHKETVQKLAAPEGQVSAGGFLYTVTRGRASVHEEEREDMVLRFSSARGEVGSFARELVGAAGTPESDQSVTQGYRATSAQYPLSTSIPFQAGQGERAPVLAVVEKDGKTEPSNGRKTHAIAGRLLGGAQRLAHLDWKNHILKALDPSLDIWLDKNTTTYSLGHHAWRLAVMFGMQDTTLTLAELRELTGLEESGLRRLLIRWRKVPLLFLLERKEGRTKTVTLNFASALLPDGDYYETIVLDHLRRNERAMRDLGERNRSARRSTPAGLLAWRLCSTNPKRERPVFGEDADPMWAALVEQGDELALYAYLLDREESAPASPQALSGPLPPAVVEAAPMVQQIAAGAVEEPQDPFLAAALAKVAAYVPAAAPQYSTYRIPVPDPVALDAMRKRITSYSR